MYISQYDLQRNENLRKQDEIRNSEQQIVNERVVEEKKIALGLLKVILEKFDPKKKEEIIELYGKCYQEVKK